tara:strand:- start:1642 stop:2340 length:699 start_codon:yes stop_codon:yes gene_type:complete
MNDRLKDLNEQNRSRHFVWNGRVNIYNSKELPKNINIDNVLSSINDRLPSFFLNNIESIYIGNLDILSDREMDAVYEDGTIYIKPSGVVGEEDLVDDIVHEVSHSLEDAYSLDIYGDAKIQGEFLNKRIKLHDLIKSEDVWAPPIEAFMETEYSKDLDTYFYKIVGYPLLTSLTMNLFSSPYGVTSLREYFANGFEKYFMGAQEEVKKISPKVYEKIVHLIEKGEEAENGNF